jgi:hypothetical protein
MDNEHDPAWTFNKSILRRNLLLIIMNWALQSLIRLVIVGVAEVRGHPHPQRGAPAQWSPRRLLPGPGR